jgi:cell division transport system ATP-binding protein
VLADEPTANLDHDTAGEMLGVFRRLQESGTTVVLASHDRDLIHGSQETVIELRPGLTAVHGRKLDQ